MRKIIYSLVLILFFSSCDYQGSYSFIVKNETEKDITIKFQNESFCSFNDNDMEIPLPPAEEKTVRIIEGALNTSSHDWLKKQKEAIHIHEILFDIY